MNDLISREALIKEMEHGKHPEFYDGQDIANWQMQCIENAPAVDAEPVRHGKWMNVCEMLPPEYHDNKRCSVCSNFALHDRLGRVRMSCYCPNCGAKMRGD